jgi:hypothetical protein
MARRDRDGYITLQAVSYETMALDTRLSFQPPLADRSPRPDGFEFWWKLIQFVYDLPPPATFRGLPTPPGGTDLGALRRYVEAAEEMAGSALLGGGDRVTLREDPDGTPRVDTNFSTNEVTRGFTTLFRQFDSKKERASFLQAQRILRAANSTTDDGTDDRTAQLQAWGKARGHLRGQNLRVRVGQKMREEDGFPDEIPGEAGLSPEQLISAYNYGDLIHWGDQAGVIQAAAGDPFHQALQRMAFLDAVAGLAHLYLGFSLVIRAALGDDASERPTPRRTTT